MRKRAYSNILIFLLLVTISGCKTLDSNLSVRQKELPAKYPDKNDTSNIASINWRQYFADSLLLKLIDSAIINNCDLQIALQRIEVSRANIKFAKSSMLPQVGINISGGLSKPGRYTAEGAGNSSTEITSGQTVPTNLPDMYLGLQSTWEIDIWGKLRNKRKSAVAQYLASVEGKNFVVSNLVTDLATAYYELVALDNTVEIIRQTIQEQQEALDVITIQKEAGRANELAVQQFQAQLLNTKALEAESLQQITETENRINFLTGSFPKPIGRIKEGLFKELPNQITMGVPAQLLINRPDIREAELQVEGSKFDLKSAKASFYPNINISANVGYQAFSTAYLFMSPASLAYSVLGGIFSPLINMGALKVQFKTAKANQLAAMYNYQRVILNGYIEVVDELSNIRSLRQINLLKKQQKEVLTKSVETSVDLYKAAKVTYLDVLLAQQNSLQSQLDFINTNRDLWLSTVKVYKALGGGWK